MGAIFAGRDSFYAVRDGQKSRIKQSRFDEAHRVVRGALNESPARKKLEDNLLKNYGEK